MPFLEYRAMKRALRNEYEIAFRNSLDLITNLKSNATLDNHQYLVVNCLRMERVS